MDTSLAPPPVHLGTLGMSGVTAYFGLLDVGRPEPGQTVVVSGAAGSVGSIVGQIARIKGCRAIGIAGGPDKCRWLVDELGFDGAVDYKAGDLRSQLRAHAPDGVDVFFDNVGGEVLDEVLLRLARGARVVISGADLPVQRDRAATGAGQLHAAAGDAGLDDRLRRVRLRAAVPRGGHATRRLAADR